MAAKPAVRPNTVDITFSLPSDVDAEKVALCGEFNDWALDEITLDRDAGGPWQVTLSLEPGRSYRYRYLLDGQRWENAWQADAYLPNPYGSDDSVINVE